MTTPSPDLLRKALKIVEEIESLDQEIHHVLANLQVKEPVPVKNRAALSNKKEETVSAVSKPIVASKETREEVVQEKIDEAEVVCPLPVQEQQKTAEQEVLSDLTVEAPTDVTSPDFGFLQHEQQSLLMEDTGIEQLLVVESHASETKEKSGEQDDQSCCLF